MVWALGVRGTAVASLAGELSARSVALVPGRGSVVCSWLVRRRRRALWAVVSVSRLSVRLTIDAAACRVRLCLRVRIRALSAVVSAGYLLAVPPLIAPRVVACDHVCWGLVVRWSARRTPPSLAPSSGPEPRHVGGAPGSAARLPVGRALLIAQAIVSGLMCPTNPNR